MDCGGIVPRIPNLGTIWRWVVSFTPWPLYFRGKNPGTRFIGSWVGLIPGVDLVAKRRKFFPIPEGNGAAFVHHVVLSMYWLENPFSQAFNINFLRRLMHFTYIFVSISSLVSKFRTEIYKMWILRLRNRWFWGYTAVKRWYWSTYTFIFRVHIYFQFPYSLWLEFFGLVL
jgi:hypothetical protein